MILLTIIFIITTYLCSAQDLVYIYPKPNTNLHSIETPIILKFDQKVNPSKIIPLISIKGIKSGLHTFQYHISSDQRTLTINTEKPFALNETVYVNIAGREIDFKTTNLSPIQQKLLFRVYFSEYIPSLNGFAAQTKNNDEPLSDTIPPDFPTVIVNSVRNPAPGYYYIANFGMGAERSYLMIIDKEGKPVKYKKVPLPGFDFKIQPNGLITNARIITSHLPQGWGWAEAYMEVMNENLEVIDTVQCNGGYIADFHDFKILPNGHYLLISYDPQPIDMSLVVENGNPNAIVLGSIIQELDADKNVVFQWRSWDHIPLTDTYAPLTGIAVDPVHINSVELDFDGNLIISSRHLSEITKISRETGEIIWRMGGKKNMFTFINEHPENAPTYFSYQHDARRQPNGNLTLYDNGNQHPTPYSRAVEYRLDEKNLIAELVWEYRNTPDIYGETMGSTQRLPNGNTVIGWGGVTTGHIRIVSEVNPAGEVEFEMSFPKGVTFQTTSYRAYKFPYPPNIPDAIVTKREISSIVNPNNPPFDTLEFNEEETGVKIVFDHLIDESSSKITVEKYSYAPLYPRFEGKTPLVNSYKLLIKSENINKFEGTFVIDLSKYPQLLHRSKLSLWKRNAIDSSFVELPSIFDEVNMQLSAKVKELDGEYIIATFDFKNPPEPPILTQPKDSSILNSTTPIYFYWTPKSLVTSSEILIAKDENFVNVVYNTNGIKSNMFVLPSLTVGRYFWKVRCSNDYGQSNWSDVFTFEIKEPFVIVKSPKENDKFEPEKSCLIIWEHNISPEFMLTLYRGNMPYFNIIDSVYSFYGKYQWTIPNIIPPGDNYKIRVTSLKDNKLFAESGMFSIEQASGVQSTDNNSKIVYPNPANEIIQLDISDATIQSLTLLDLFGNEVKKTSLISNGKDKITIDLKDISSGMYFIKLQSGRGLIIEKFIVIKN